MRINRILWRVCKRTLVVEIWVHLDGRRECRWWTSPHSLRHRIEWNTSLRIVESCSIRLRNRIWTKRYIQFLLNARRRSCSINYFPFFVVLGTWQLLVLLFLLLRARGASGRFFPYIPTPIIVILTTKTDYHQLYIFACYTRQGSRLAKKVRIYVKNSDSLLYKILCDSQSSNILS